ncbi:MAG: response regulator, partial [Chloroflexota bacterium]
RMLEQLLAADGFTIQRATSRAEALEKIQAERFHIAIIDARLDDNDPYNHDGLSLLRELRVLDPSTAVILLTIAADLDIVREAIYSAAGEIHPVFEVSGTAASAYLEKTPHALRWLPRLIQRLVNEVVRMNWGLQIYDLEQFVMLIPRRMRFTNSPDIPQLQEELEELLRKLFSEWERIDIRTIADQNQGYSKAFVFQVTPRSADGPEPMVIAKVGEQSIIEQEVLRYRDYVERIPRTHRIPAAIEPIRRTRALGGMIYTFHGLGGNVRDFAQFYRSTKDHEQITEVIENLFTDTLVLQHNASRVTHQRADLRPVYTNLLRIDHAELQERLNELFLIARSLGHSSASQKFWLEYGTTLVNPLEYALKGNFKASYVETTIHGELHTHNVLVDHCNETWLIDFANTGRGPLLHDYAAFEVSLLIDANEYPGGRVLADWSRTLFEQPGNLFPQMPAHLAKIPELAKVYHSITTVRRLALRERVHPQGVRTYLISLFFTCLRMMSVRFLVAPKRFQALTLAALIAENLMSLENSAPH